MGCTGPTHPRAHAMLTFEPFFGSVGGAFKMKPHTEAYQVDPPDDSSTLLRLIT
jgi:hypothetical protein